MGVRKKEKKSSIGKKKMQNLLTTAGLVRDCPSSIENGERLLTSKSKSQQIS
jgi:hypothetical protein